MTDARTGAPFRTAVGLLRRTTPFLLVNAAIYGGFFLATVLWLGLFGGLAAFFATRVEVLAWILLLVAIAVPAGLLAFARRYVLYLVQGAHIAVATKLLLEGQLPDGQKQVAYGRSVVQDNFRDVSILFALDRLIDGVVKRFTRRFVRLVDWLPLGGGASRVARLAAQVVERSLSYVDEAILSYAIALNEHNVWRSARHGLILYAQAYKPILGSAVKIWLLGRLVFVGALLLVAVPGVAILLVFDAIWFQVAVVVATILLASLLVRAVYEPFATVYTLVTYHRAIVGVEVNATWDRRLQSVSDEFRKLVGRAREHDVEPDPLDEVELAPGDMEPGGMELGDADAAAPASNGHAGGAPSGREARPATPQPRRNPVGAAGVLGGGRGGVGGITGGLGGMLARAAQGAADSAQRAAENRSATPGADPEPQPETASDEPLRDDDEPRAPAG